LLLSSQSDGIETQVGIVSFGSKTCGELPGVYTRISSVYEWIKESVCEVSSNPPDHFQCTTQHPTSAPTNESADFDESVGTASPTKLPKSVSPSMLSTFSPSYTPSVQRVPSKEPKKKVVSKSPSMDRSNLPANAVAKGVSKTPDSSSSGPKPFMGAEFPLSLTHAMISFASVAIIFWDTF
jgi:hypothetical protein